MSNLPRKSVIPAVILIYPTGRILLNPILQLNSLPDRIISTVFLGLCCLVIFVICLFALKSYGPILENRILGLYLVNSVLILSWSIFFLSFLMLLYLLLVYLVWWWCSNLWCGILRTVCGQFLSRVRYSPNGLWLVSDRSHGWATTPIPRFKFGEKLRSSDCWTVEPCGHSGFPAQKSV